MVGTADGNWLYGDSGNDVLDGQRGDDYLNGVEGDDVYRYRSGDGNDIVGDWSGNDTIELLDLAPGDVRIIQGMAEGADRIVDQRTGQALTLNLGLAPSSEAGAAGRIEQVRFADGTVWGLDAMRAAAADGQARAGMVEPEAMAHQLVQAMATFSPPAPGELSLASSWQSSPALMLAAGGQ